VADFLCALSVVGHSAVSFTDLRIILSVCRSRGELAGASRRGM